MLRTTNSKPLNLIATLLAAFRTSKKASGEFSVLSLGAWHNRMVREPLPLSPPSWGLLVASAIATTGCFDSSFTDSLTCSQPLAVRMGSSVSTTFASDAVLTKWMADPLAVTFRSSTSSHLNSSRGHLCNCFFAIARGEINRAAASFDQADREALGDRIQSGKFDAVVGC